MRTARAHLLAAMGGAVAAWVVLDLAREQRLGIADASAWCTAAASLIGVTAVLALGRWPERRRTTWLMLAWVLTQTLPDAGVAFIALMWRRLRRAAPGARRTLAPLALAACFAAADFVLVRLAWLTDRHEPLAALGWIDVANSAVLPAAIFLGIATIRRHRGPLGDLVIELRDAGPDAIAPALARAVGDPTLELVDSAPPAVAPGRAVTVLRPRERPVAALVHDANLAGQRELLEAAASAALLALENARLRMRTDMAVAADGRLVACASKNSVRLASAGVGSASSPNRARRVDLDMRRR